MNWKIILLIVLILSIVSVLAWLLIPKVSLDEVDSQNSERDLYENPLDEVDSQNSERDLYENPLDEVDSQNLDWTLYNDTYFGFEIKYPSDWFINSDVQIISTVKEGDQQFFGILPENNATIRFKRTGVQSIDELIAERLGLATNYIIVSDSMKEVGDLIGRQVVYTCKNCEDEYISEIDKHIPIREGRVIFFSKDGDVLYFWLSYYKNDSKSDYYINVFNQLFSTFKFIN